MLRFLAAFAIALPALAQTNRVLNFSFEQRGDPSSMALNWGHSWNGYERDCVTGNVWDGSCTIRMIGTSANLSGAIQRVYFNQPSHIPIRIDVQVKGRGIANVSDDKYGAIIYCRVKFVNLASLSYCPTTGKTKNVGTFDWRYIGVNTTSLINGHLPIEWVEVVPMMGAVSGTAWFDDIHIAEYPPGIFNGAVTLIFDDCYKEHRTYVMPALQSRGWVGAEAVVTNYPDSGDPAYCNWNDVGALHNAGWEILSHSVTHRNVTMLSPYDMDVEMYWSKKVLSDRGFNPKSFVLPFGEYNADSLGLNEERGYYVSIRNSDQGYNPTGAFPHSMRVQKMESDVSLAEVNALLTEARNRKAWLVLLFHKVRDTCPDAICVTKSMFQNTLTAVQGSTLPVVTYDQGLNLVKALE